MTLVPYSKLRNHQNRRVTRGLFPDFCPDTQFSFFTLKRWDLKPDLRFPDGLVSFPMTYLSYCIDDPTEYNFAISVFGDWEHWQLVSELNDLRHTIKALREERDIAIKSKGFQHIAQEVAEQGKNAFAAAKWLAEKGWEVKPSDSRRKTTKAAQKAAEEESKTDRAAIDLAKSLSEELGLNKLN